MSSTTTTHENRDINQILSHKSEGSFLNDNKIAIIAVIAIVVLLVLGYGTYSVMADKSNSALNAKIYDYEMGPMANLVKDSANAEAVSAAVLGFKTLSSEAGSYVGILPVALTTSDTLVKANKFSEALSVLESALGAASSDYAKFFILSRLAVVYEDLGQNDKAIETLTKMTSNSVKVFEGKIYLDLGRLYLAKGDTEKAKANFTHVVEKANTDVEFVKIAQIHLANLK